jgi:hypothetical protein
MLLISAIVTNMFIVYRKRNKELYYYYYYFQSLISLLINLCRFFHYDIVIYKYLCIHRVR